MEKFYFLNWRFTEEWNIKSWTLRLVTESLFIRSNHERFYLKTLFHLQVIDPTGHSISDRIYRELVNITPIIFTSEHKI